MFEILAFTLQILAAPAATPATTTTCHWKTADLGRHYNLSPKSRRRACRWEPTLQTAARRHRLDPDLLGALIVIESAWLPWIVSSADACGLTQVIPKWTGSAASGRRKWTCNQLKQPQNSIPVGARILRWWIDYHAEKLAANSRLSKDEKTARATREGLCGYSAGFRGCKRAGARYARKVLHIQKRLRAARVALTPPKALPKASSNTLQGNN